MTISVRQARPADVDLIADFNARMALETEQKHLDRDVLKKGVSAVVSDSTKGIYFVAECEGHTVGQTLVTYEWSDWRNGTFWWIQSVYVPESWRGKGVFTALYRWIESKARADESVCGLRLYVERHNERAQATYVNLGMTKTEYELFEVDWRK